MAAKWITGGWKLTAVVGLAMLAAAGCEVPEPMGKEMAAAMARNDGAGIRGVLATRPAQARASDELGQTPLHWAAEHGDAALAEQVLKEGAKVNAFAKRPARTGREPTDLDFCEEMTPLHVAVVKGHWDVARLLVKHGADVNVVTGGCGDGYNSYTPLELAVAEADMEFVEFLIRAGANVPDCGNQFHWPLEMAMEREDEKAAERTDVMAVLLEHGADIEWWGVDGYTTLHMAVFNNHPAGAAFLLDHGAKVDPLDYEGGTPLHLAAQYGNLKCAQILLAHGANPALKNNQGQTPLMVAQKAPGDSCEASIEQRKPVAQLLLGHGGK